VSKLDEFVNAAASMAAQIADGSGSPSELGVQIWSLALETHGDGVGEVSGPLWHVWGTLTDVVDWPGRDGEVAEAEVQIKRAAEERLHVAHDPEARQQYLDRWLYEEFGMQQQDWSDY
jgi:hypothetical protein